MHRPGQADGSCKTDDADPWAMPPIDWVEVGQEGSLAHGLLSLSILGRDCDLKDFNNLIFGTMHRLIHLT